MAGIHILNGDTLAQTFVSDPGTFGRDRQKTKEKEMANVLVVNRVEAYGQPTTLDKSFKEIQSAEFAVVHGENQWGMGTDIWYFMQIDGTSGRIAPYAVTIFNMNPDGTGLSVEQYGASTEDGTLTRGEMFSEDMPYFFSFDLEGGTVTTVYTFEEIWGAIFRDHRAPFVILNNVTAGSFQQLHLDKFQDDIPEESVQGYARFVTLGELDSNGMTRKVVTIYADDTVTYTEEPEES